MKGKTEAEMCDTDLWAPIEVTGRKVGWDSSKCNAQLVHDFLELYAGYVRVLRMYT